MGRSGRLLEAGMAYHVMAKGSDGAHVFAKPEDRDAFVRILDRVALRYRWELLAYCVMGNHVHLVVQPVGLTLPDGMRNLLGHYGRRACSLRAHNGHTFASRYRCEEILTDEYLVSAIRYVLLNLVQAGLVDRVQRGALEQLRRDDRKCSERSGGS